MPTQHNPEIQSTAKKKRIWYYAMFIVINLLLSSYYLDIWLTPNATSRALPILTFYENKTITIDKFKDYTLDKSEVKGHYYSDKAPLSSFVVYPFYAAYKKLGFPELKDSTVTKYPIYILSWPFIRGNNNYPDGRLFVLPETSTVFILADILCGSIPFTIIMFLALLAAIRTSSSSSLLHPVIAVMLSFYSSYLLVYAGTFTGHMLSGVLVLAGYVFMKKKNYLLSGAMVGLAVAAEFTVGMLLPLWALLILINERKISKPVLFGLGAIPGVLLIMIYNYHITGSPLLTPYSYLANNYARENIGFTHPQLDAFLGITISTFRGMLIYAPVLFLLLLYVIWNNKNSIKEFFTGKARRFIGAGIKNYFRVTVAVYLLIISSYFMWTGGWAYGPRQIIPLAIICLYEGVIYMMSKKIMPYFFYIISTIGLLFVWMDKSTKVYELPDDPSTYPNPVFNVVIPDFLKHRFNTNMLPVFFFDSNPVIAIYAWPVLFLAGLIILSLIYSKLVSSAAPRRNRFYVPAVCLLIVYVIIFIPGNGKDKFSVDTSGGFGGFSHSVKGSVYLDSAQKAKDQAQKLKYYSLSKNEYKSTITCWPLWSTSYYNLGLCYDAIGCRDSAMKAFKKSLELNPQHTPALNYVGILLLNDDQYDSAMHYFDMACKIDSNYLLRLIEIGKPCLIKGYSRKRKMADSLYFAKEYTQADEEYKDILRDYYYTRWAHILSVEAKDSIENIVVQSKNALE